MERSPSGPRGYFGIGVERLGKPGNLGDLMRTAHAFGASFFFTIDSALDAAAVQAADTSLAGLHLPVYAYTKATEFFLPEKCVLVGVEIADHAVELPSFRHPPCAAYVLGPEHGSLSPELLARCDHVVRIPSRFCIHVGMAGALVMYDRLLSTGHHAPRPEHAGGPLPESPPMPPLDAMIRSNLRRDGESPHSADPTKGEHR
ncbi:MAG: TrmH family RNA methyltransferase [Alphaproteobacteria bacterium]|nr:MAG: TrmH family RNA methyltransferase [Alphaproteobacteria bacterium]